MAFVNELEKQIALKIAYFGLELSGKRSNLRFLHEALPAEERGRFLRLERKGDSVLFFECHPSGYDNIGPYAPRIHLYAALGEPKNAATSLTLLRGADGVVFVADANEEKLDENRKQLELLKSLLARLEIKENDFPLVMQFNKVDLPGALAEEDLDEELNEFNAPFYSANAATGVRVEETFSAAARLAHRRVSENLKARRFKGWFKFTSLDALLKKNFDTMEDYTEALKRSAFEEEALGKAGVDESEGIAEFQSLDEKSDLAALDALLEETDVPEEAEAAADADSESALEALFSEDGESAAEGEALAAQSESTLVGKFSLGGAAGNKTILAAPSPAKDSPKFDRTVRMDRSKLNVDKAAAKSLGLDEEEQEEAEEEAEERTISVELKSDGEDPQTITIPIELSGAPKKTTLNLRLEIRFKS
ncbi:MAG: hypothetical protein JSV08_01200 [Acidobacteriota bacterium]|nr:MAG: hypothetical protein JSV08_01200 [Acidobacteriota bacterium]